MAWFRALKMAFEGVLSCRRSFSGGAAAFPTGILGINRWKNSILDPSQKPLERLVQDPWQLYKTQEQFHLLPRRLKEHLHGETLWKSNLKVAKAEKLETCFLLYTGEMQMWKKPKFKAQKTSDKVSLNHGSGKLTKFCSSYGINYSKFTGITSDFYVINGLAWHKPIVMD